MFQRRCGLRAAGAAMADFAYRAIDTDGRERCGRMRATDAAAATARLRARGLAVIACDTAPPRAPYARAPWAARRLSLPQLSLFTRQLATLARVSPLEEALRICAAQAGSARAQAAIARVHGAVVEGQSLARALGTGENGGDGGDFPPLYRAMVAAGEGAGQLPTILDRLAASLERQAAVRSKLLATLAYPVILAIVALLVVAALMLFVVPTIVDQFDSIGQQLPLLTRVIMGISAFATQFWWLILAAMLAAAIALRVALRREKSRLAIDGALLRLPLIGRLIRDWNAARFARTLATMVESRLPLVDGLALSVPGIANHALRRASRSLAEDVRSGSSLSAAMARAGIFPPILLHLVSSGENAGALDTMLAAAANHLEQDYDRFVTSAMALVEPAIILIMGAIVATIILSILLPILQLQQLSGV